MEPVWVRTRRAPGAKSKPRPFAGKEIAAAVGIGILADVTLFRRDTLSSGGFGLALLFGLLPAALFLACRSWRNSTRLGAIAGLLVMVAFRCLYQATPGVVLSGLALVIAFGLGLRMRHTFGADVVAAAGAAVTKIPSRLGAAAAGVRGLAARTRLGGVSLLPIVVPMGLVAVFLGVFALANPVLAHALDVAWSTCARVVALPPLERLLLWGGALVLATALLRPALRLPRGSEHADASGAASEATTTALLVARNALVGLNVLFLGYNALDARYLWTGTPPGGMHTQQYAHQGAFWLTLALVMLTAVVGVMFRGALAHDVRARAIRRLAYVWTAQGLVLGLGTYRRIAIHITKSGLSDLRIVGVLGTSLVICGVVLVAWKLRSGRTFLWLVRRQLDAFALIAIVYALVPTHRLSAGVNVARVQRGEYRPILHSFRQSHETESAAVYLALLDHPDVRVRQGVAALLLEQRDHLRAVAEARRSWREGDIVTGHTLAALEGATPRLESALGSVAPLEAKRVLLEISRAANEDRSIEDMLAISAAQSRSDFVH